MYLVAIEILLIWIAFILGIYTQHLLEVASGLWQTPENWWWIVIGMWNSNTFIALAIMIALSFAIYFINKRQKSRDDENTEQLIDKVIKRTDDQRNQDMKNLINRMDRLIERLGGQNDTNK